MRKKHKIMAAGLLCMAAMAFAGCGSREEEDAFLDDMEALDEEELAIMEGEGDEDVIVLDEEEVDESMRESASELEKQGGEDAGDPVVTEEELDAQVMEELEDSGLAIQED